MSFVDTSESSNDRPLLENIRNSSSSDDGNHHLVYRGTSEIIPIIGDSRPQIVIGAEPLEDQGAKGYSGQRQILPGIIALVLALALGFAGVTYFSIQEYQATLDQQLFLLAQASNVSGIFRL